MSIVERAMQKLQSRSTRPAAAATVQRDVEHGHPAPISPTVPLRAPEQTPAPAATGPVPWSTKQTIRFNRELLRAQGILPPEHQERLIANQYRQIKRPLIANAMGKNVPAISNGNLIMVASALPGEGKTFTSVNLAISLSTERDFAVLLVDADVAKPHISNVFGLADNPGLLDYLQDESLDVESLIVGTEIERLAILPAGRPRDAATELLASSRMAAAVRALSKGGRNRIIVFDSPPLVLTNESRIITSLVGQVVLVVRAGITPQQVVLDAINHIEAGKSVGLVLNQSEVEEGPHYYGYESYGGNPLPGESGT